MSRPRVSESSLAVVYHWLRRADLKKDHDVPERKRLLAVRLDTPIRLAGMTQSSFAGMPA
jgi:hypothetical protein